MEYLTHLNNGNDHTGGTQAHGMGGNVIGEFTQTAQTVTIDILVVHGTGEGAHLANGIAAAGQWQGAIENGVPILVAFNAAAGELRGKKKCIISSRKPRNLVSIYLQSSAHSPT